MGRRRSVLSACLLLLVVLVIGAAVARNASTPYQPGGDLPGFKRIDPPFGARFYGVSALDRGSAWVVGDAGVVLHYDGTNWSRHDAGTTLQLNAVCAIDPSHVWVVGSRGFAALFDGRSWRAVPTGVDRELTAVSALDPEHVWAVGWGGIVLFFDGERWSTERLDAAVLRGVRAVDRTEVWAVGDSGLLYRYDGDRWARRPSGTDLELTAVAAAPGAPQAVGLEGTIVTLDGKSARVTHDGNTTFRGVARTGDSRWAVGFSRPLWMHRESLVLQASGDGPWLTVPAPEGLYPTAISVAEDGSVFVAGLGGVCVAR
ncbi:MAG: hypothetical protein V1748_00660 [Actinomycetota bacterium]